MGKKLRIILVFILCISIILTGCKKNAGKDTEEVDNESADIVTETGEDSEEYISDNPTGNSTTAGIPSVITVGDQQRPNPPEITGVASFPADGIGVVGVDYPR